MINDERNSNLPSSWFRSLPLEKKLTVTVFTTAAVALTLMAVSLISLKWVSGTNDLKSHLKTHALLIESSASAAILFDDYSGGQEALKYLKSFKQIDYASILTDDGDIFASYNFSGHSHTYDSTIEEGYYDSHGHLTLTNHIYFEGEKLGTIMIAANYNELYNSIALYIAFTVLIFSIILFISIAMSKIPKNLISTPIKELCNSADRVSNTHDYTLRATKRTNDEIGTLVDKFNEMLDVIEANNKTINKQNKNLLKAQSIAKLGNYEWFPQTNEVLLSKQALQILDLPAHLKNPPLDFLINRLNDESATAFKEAIGVLISREQNSISVEYSITLINNTKRYLVDELTVQYGSNGDITSIMGVTQDITERKTIETDIQRAQKLDSIGILAGGIAHDFNNILTMIMGQLSLAKIEAEKTGSERLFNCLDKSENAAYRAKDLTSRLITFAKGSPIDINDLNLKLLIVESAEMAFSGSRIIHSESLNSDSYHVAGDYGMISQVINNIYINAVQAMENGGLVTTTLDKVTLKRGNSSNLPPGEYVSISIKDQGPGISKKDIPHIFDPYFTTKKTGTGLGLASCYSIIRKHKGSIEVNSELNKGTEFKIYLPASNDMSHDDVITTDNDSRFLEGSGKILVMDDEDTICDYMQHILGKYGYTSDYSLNGEDALKLYMDALDKDPYDIVIMDLTVKGGMGGKDLIKELVEVNPQVKAIVSSGYSEDPILVNHKQFGFTASVIKPFKTDKLLRTIKLVMDEIKEQSVS